MKYLGIVYQECTKLYTLYYALRQNMPQPFKYVIVIAIKIGLWNQLDLKCRYFKPSYWCVHSI